VARLSGLSAILALLVGGTSWAEEPPASPRPAAAKEDRGPVPAAGAGMKAAVDRQTGKLRRPTAEEEKELDEATAQLKQAQAPVVATQAVQHANGMTSLVLGPEFLEFMNTAVATVNPDGTVSWTCVPDRLKVDELARSGIPTPQAAALEEK
jgi:hypothetical protein